jgi:hypothetical protein
VTAVPPEPGHRFESAAISVDIFARVRPIAWVVLVASVVLIGPGAVVGSAAITCTFLLLMASALGTLVLRRLRWIGPGPGTIAIDEPRVALSVSRKGRSNVEKSFHVGDITSGYRTDDEVTLRLARGDVVTLVVDGPQTAEALLRALGQDARRRALAMKLPAAASRYPGLTTFAWLIVITQLPSLTILPFAMFGSCLSSPNAELQLFLAGWTLIQVAVVSIAIQILKPRPVAIGTDGIVVRRLFRDRFFPYASISKVKLVEGGVALALRDAGVLRLRTQSWRKTGEDSLAQALLERIQAARGAAAVDDDVHAKLVLLERKGRTLDAWRAHLASLVDKAGYRTSAVTERDLAAVVTDGSLSAEHRIAATLALAAADRGEARARVRIAADACADRELRIALEEASEGEVDDTRVGRLFARS